MAFGGWQLGLDGPARAARRRHAIDQPQPFSTPETRGAYRHAANGAWLARHGKENAARHQAAGGAPQLGDAQSADVSHSRCPSRVGTSAAFAASERRVRAL